MKLKPLDGGCNAAARLGLTHEDGCCGRVWVWMDALTLLWRTNEPQNQPRNWEKLVQYGTLCMDSDKNVLSITRYDNYTQMIADDC